MFNAVPSPFGYPLLETLVPYQTSSTTVTSASCRYESESSLKDLSYPRQKREISNSSLYSQPISSNTFR